MTEPMTCQCLGHGPFTMPDWPWTAVDCETTATAEDGLCDYCRAGGGEAGKITGGELHRAMQYFSKTGDRTELDRVEGTLWERMKAAEDGRPS